MSKSWEQILSGYATDTLTEEEKRQLFEAALHDQTLFDALADEEALKALLADPEVCQRILASLQTSGEPQGSAPSSRSGWSWFRQPSSLAWAGSIAAMGLALIFGWQMEKDWGPLIQQERQVERSVSEDKDEVTFRSQPSGIVELNEETPAPKKKNQRESEPVAPIPAPTRTPQPLTIAKALKDTDRIRQRTAKFRSEGVLRQEAKNERRLKAKESMATAPESRVASNVPEEDQFVAPSMEFSRTAEDDFQQLSQPATFADRVQKKDVLSSPGARKLFYANQGRRADEAGKELEGMRAQQLLGGMSSKAEKALTEEVSDLRETQEVVKDYSLGQNRGIRYSFVQKTLDSKDESIDIKQFSGHWVDLRLAIESNVSGHLYVLTDLGKGQWQFVIPESFNVPASSDGAIKVKPYQPVNFALSQVTNTLGKPVVSSITVLLSSSPLGDLGRWLGMEEGQGQSEGRLTEQAAQEVFLVDSSLGLGVPLQVNISLKYE